jgi:hypothetical protein
MRLIVLLTVPLLMAFCAVLQAQAAPPEATISNGLIKAKLYLPDQTNGFYRGTRFDWSGVVASLEYNGHNYYGPWFTGTDPSVSDFIYKGSDIIAGPCSAITGPVQEFNPALGYDEAKSGGTFLKIGVGILRKGDESKYSAYTLFPIVNGGKWTVHKGSDWIEFTQELHDSASGYGYIYHKKLSLVKGKPQMVMEHSLKNTGTVAIQSNVYNHNFLVLDHQTTSDAFSITLPFTVKADPAPDAALAEVQGSQILYRKPLVDEDRVYFEIDGFGQSADDYKVRIDNAKAKAGMTITGDRPLYKMSLWSIRSVIALEPFIEVSVAPGSETSWKYSYEYSAHP